MMKQLLDEELVDEDTFLAWAGDFTRNEYSVDQVMRMMMMMMLTVMMMMIRIMSL